jgi:glycosyltransferase involved in cell wall biosynthesis
MSRPIRFLQLTTFYPPFSFGGDALYVYRLAHELADRGHMVDVVHCIDSYRLLAGDGPAAPLPAHPNVSVHGLRSAVGSLSPVLSHQTGRPLFKRAALRRVLDQQIDVIHFHNVSLFGPGVLGIAGDRRSIVKLYTTHEHWLVCPTHVLWKFEQEPCERPACFRCTLAAGRPPQLWRYTGLLARASRSIDQFIAPSVFTARLHADRGFERPLAHLPPFAPRQDDDWRAPGMRPHARPYFLFVGRLERVKGIETLLRTWDRVPDVDLVVVGDGSERARVAAAAAANPRIVLRGAVPPGSLGPYFVHALACLVPSVTYEVAPTVVLEAFARKTPVVARDLGGTSEFVGESGGGLLFRTEPELLEALRRLSGDPSLRRDLGDNGYQAFLRRWTPEVHVTAYIELIERLAQTRLGDIPWRPAGSGSEAPAVVRPPLVGHR